MPREDGQAEEVANQSNRTGDHDGCCLVLPAERNSGKYVPMLEHIHDEILRTVRARNRKFRRDYFPFVYMDFK